MEIIDNRLHELVSKYDIGDVIQDENSTYMIIELNGKYGMLDFRSGVADGGYDSLEEFYNEAHIDGERKVNASVVIDGDAV